MRAQNWVKKLIILNDNLNSVACSVMFSATLKFSSIRPKIQQSGFFRQKRALRRFDVFGKKNYFNAFRNCNSKTENESKV